MRFLLFTFCLAALGGARAGLPHPSAIPFEFSEGFLWIHVEVPQSARPLNFLFDTGAGVSVINNGTARRLGLGAGYPVQVQGVHDTMTGSWPVKFTSSAEGMALPDKYLALDLSELGRACGRPLDGLLGADFLQGRVTEIDFATHQLRFLNQISVAKSDTVIPLKVSNGCFCVPVGVDAETNQWLRLDTGCATPLQWVAFGVQVGALSRRPAVGLAKFSIPQTVTTVCLGDRHFDHMPTGVHGKPIFPGESGLLGNGLLNRFKTITIDAVSNRLILGQLRTAN